MDCGYGQFAILQKISLSAVQLKVNNMTKKHDKKYDKKHDKKYDKKHDKKYDKKTCKTKS